MLKKIKVQDAVGTELAHDITEIRPGEFKGPAFRMGHNVCEDDICNLQKLGKNHLYVIQMEEEDIHENQAAAILAKGLAGDGVYWNNDPKEGKIGLHAKTDGLLSINTETLTAFNMIDEVMCATLHNNTLVKKDELVGATRAIPLVMKRLPIDNAHDIAQQAGGVISVRTLRKASVALVITGNEIFNGLIEDRFQPVLSNKITKLGSHVLSTEFAPDDPLIIQQTIEHAISNGCDLILLSGGMSVDPDDVTRKGIELAGAVDIHYGAAVLPGAMFMTASLNGVPILGIPACGLYHDATVLDLILPRILAGEKITKKNLAILGHGGLCKDCKMCTFPHCPFGK